MFDTSQATQFIGQELRTNDGNKIGKIGQVYLDLQQDVPEWVTVNTGLFGMNESFVPLAEARLDDDGGLLVPYTKDQIKDAPNISGDGQLSEDEERSLYEHYGVSYSSAGSTLGGEGGGTGYTDTSSTAFTDSGTTGTGYGADRNTSVRGDDAITRSEQRLDRHRAGADRSGAAAQVGGDGERAGGGSGQAGEGAVGERAGDGGEPG